MPVPVGCEPERRAIQRSLDAQRAEAAVQSTEGRMSPRTMLDHQLSELQSKHSAVEEALQCVGNRQARELHRGSTEPP